ncbi:putative TIR domain, winged helix-turn-helix DNA-binding domain-containing protein [Lupinus albus]|uniref:Putative TIR domain, winged helix-turn-helix DNA-binding domain-containing protein n=1 Tax=Lupinus albus TaxID=3870 RepID=A0A6A4N843_LUPAL|nr:putative TIR domain, winged helix-turn-helix DNA-binding domain-containing protein [Lupinus albus]
MAHQNGWFYHVFLSFRGEDTRETFTGNLYNALDQRGINTFIDDEELRIGEEISPSLLKAIENSRIAIIIFSKNYASSTWCLDELLSIMECKKHKGQVVCSVFYNVNPSDVRHQKGSYEEAFVMLEERFKGNMEKVQKWRSALHEAANLSGWHFSNGYEFKFIQRIVDEVSSKLNLLPLNVARHPIGLEARLSDVNSLLELGCGEVRMVGIYGIGGIGKTTIAKAVYNTVCNQFRYASFLSNVGENASHRTGLVKLQERLLYEILGEKTIRLGNVDRGINIIKDRLCRKRLLLVLDNVDDTDQLQALAGGFDWFGPGSRIIITSRDKHLLTAHQIDLTYEVKKLNHDEALQLFSWNAFGQSEPDLKFFEISNRAVCYAEGHPLALTILGSDLCGRSIHQWESALDKYKKTPNRKVQDILRISFDGLEENEKEIFLYIACFFKGEIETYAAYALRACDLHPAIGIAVLVDKSLITVSERGVLSMHDLIQDMGKEIVRQESPLDPGNRSRLWYYEDVLQVLAEGMGTDKIQGIMLDLPEKQEVQLSAQALKKMKNLRMLIIRNAEFSGGPLHIPRNLRMLDWKEYPSPSLPFDFFLEKVAMLELTHSRLTLDKPFKKYVNMTSLNLSSSKFLTKIPDVSGIPKLEILRVEGCTSLVEIHESVGSLDRLFYLGFEGCTELKNLPTVFNMSSLGCIVLNGCSQLENFPSFLGKMDKLRVMEMEETAIQVLPSCVVNFNSLQILVLKHCFNLKELPITIDMLPNLQMLDISGCPQLQPFSEKLRNFSTKNCSTVFPESDEGSSNLELLPASCLDLISPNIHSSYGFPLMETLQLSDCNLIDDDLHVLSSLSNLMSLDISRNQFVTLPECFNRLGRLQELLMANCGKLQQICGIPPNLEYIDANSCTLLNSQSVCLLLSQGSCKMSKFEVIAPRPRTPIPLKYDSKGGSMSFWICHKFPRIALCFIFANKRIGYFICEVQLSINGQIASSRELDLHSVTCDFAWLYNEDVMGLNTYLNHEQNFVEVSCEIVHASKDAEITIYCCGVHEYKDEEDVKKTDLVVFTSSSPNNNTRVGCKVDEYFDRSQFSSETGDNHCHCDNNPGIGCCSFPNKSKPGEISDQHLKQLSGSINLEMLEDDGCVAHENGKTTAIMLVDAMHQSKEMHSLHLQLYDDDAWDPMLLECQLNCVNENRLLAEDCHISINKGYEELENIELADHCSELKGPPMLDDLAAIPMEHNTTQFDLTSKDDNMEAFYAALHAETFALSSLTLSDTEADSKLAYSRMSEETKKALEILKEFLSKQFCQLLDQGSYTSMKTALEYLCTLSANDDDSDVSLALKSLIQQFSTEITQWSCDYIDANKKLESSTTFLVKLETLEEGLITNKNQFIEVVSIENELCSKLVYLEERKKELEEQINDVKANITISALARNNAVRKKRETYEEAIMLKTQRDELRKLRPRLRAEQESAKATKGNIEDEWLKIKDKFDRIFIN